MAQVKKKLPQKEMHALGYNLFCLVSVKTLV
jgi:hypothetical protein